MSILNLRSDINRKFFTTVNYSKKSDKKNEYVVIHYVGAEGSAEANAKFFQNTYKGASAHAFVDHSGPIYQIVNWDDIAWHCGTSSGYKHKYCRNSNSIGIELCCHKDSNGQWYFNNVTIEKAADLTVALMLQYDIPMANVIRHYDVTGKICPEPYVRDANAWKAFLKLVKTKLNDAKGKYATLKGVYLRDTNFAVVKDYDKLDAIMRRKCKPNANGSVTFKKGKKYTAKYIKQDDNGSIWGITKKGYAIPIVFKGDERSIKAN